MRDLDGVAGAHVYDVRRVGVVHVVAAAAARVIVVDELSGTVSRASSNRKVNTR